MVYNSRAVDHEEAHKLPEDYRSKDWQSYFLQHFIQQQISFVSLVKNCNHKGLGIYYLLSAFIFGISGTLISVLIRIELYSSGNRIISPENQNFYNISITLHGFLMIFFLVMPGLFGGFGNYFVVIFQGSPNKFIKDKSPVNPGIE